MLDEKVQQLTGNYDRPASPPSLNRSGIYVWGYRRAQGNGVGCR